VKARPGGGEAVEDEDALMRLMRLRSPKRKLSVSWKATWDEKKSEEAEEAARQHLEAMQPAGGRRMSVNFELFDVKRKVRCEQEEDGLCRQNVNSSSPAL
jgi:hypothetical protein